MANQKREKGPSNSGAQTLAQGFPKLPNKNAF